MKDVRRGRAAFLAAAVPALQLLAACQSDEAPAGAATPQAVALTLGGTLPLPGEAALVEQPACVASGLGTDHRVGPGQTYAELDQVPWESLKAGDTVRIFHRSSPYRGKFMLAAQGTAAAPVRVCGVRGSNGERPVIDGRGATTRAALAASFAGSASAIYQARAVVMVRAAGDSWTTRPSHLRVDGLKIVGAHPQQCFRDTAGLEQAYEQFAACIWIDRGDQIVLADNELAGCSMGVFSRSTDDAEATQTRGLKLVGNHFHDNGIVGSWLEHHSYTQGLDVLIEHNLYGPLTDGALGNAIKDRSAGLVVRYNRIEGGAHSLDLVEAEDFPVTALARPDYRVTRVYGNQIRKDGETGSLVHYGGDHYGSTPGARWGEPIYRGGTLHFFHNTVLVTGRAAAIFQLSTTGERAEVRDNLIVFADTVTQRSLRMGQSVGASWTTGGTLVLGRNWISAGWQDTDPWHPIGGELVLETAQPGDAVPPVEPLAGLPADSGAGWTPRTGRGVTGAAQALPEALSAYPVQWQKGLDGRSQARALSGAGADLGAMQR
ncbi:hypothetical protein [Sphaerotilus uruguayifluvii]|uniref:Right-handed parallel beta-helix repeat-containing protein n=1 Tax=Sphaerotilus uruguayifluvii TaxID=2735897 RepID=A0ABX2G2T5_9BURK|nr:hypothetical protein [Leptothrix sp. C29]NRT56597.1 hypothetical protein [Leptothrix sp. C29]